MKEHKTITVVAVVILLGVIGVSTIFGVRAYAEKQLELQKAKEVELEEAKIAAETEKEVTRVKEAAATERTEERSQFWQKAIPWGKDESEESKE